MQSLCKITAPLKLRYQLIDLPLGVAECDGKLRCVHIEQSAHHLYLGLRLYFIIVLGYLRHGQLFLHDLDDLRILLEILSDLLDGCRHSCREHHRLALLRKLA